MLFEAKIPKVTLSLLVVAAVGGLFVHLTQRNPMNKEVADKLVPNKQVHEVARIELKAESPDILEKTDASQKITLKQGNLEINDQFAVQKFTDTPVEDQINEPFPFLPSDNNEFVGVSITNTSDNILPTWTEQNQLETEPNEMIVVENMGRPQGVAFRPQPAKNMVQKGLESKELKILEEKQMLRKSNFAKSLEQRETRKALFKHRN